jgi:ribosomal peptide maturation radical SAM protein 1
MKALPEAPIGGEQARRDDWPVVLVSMPFMAAEQPSIQVGLLAAIVRNRGFPVRTLHGNLDLAARLGAEPYQLLAQHRGFMLGEWLFSCEAFGDAAPDPDGRMLEDPRLDLDYLEAMGPDWRADLLKIRRQHVPAFLDDLVKTLLSVPVRVVGFSCTFQQNAASFALARRLKARRPDLVTVFGGANFDDAMGAEFLRRVDCIDVVVRGEGDWALPALLDALAGGSDPAAVPGVARRSGDTIVATPPAPPTDRLDDLPVPDYAEYFQHAGELGLFPGRGRNEVWIPFESARGCWWGAKHHCVFCGLNGTTMRFRAKSADRVLAELAELVRRHDSYHFAAVDNILEPAYFRDLLPRLIESDAGFDLFYEIKANLTRAQIRLLAQAGVRRIQPGIESLSSRVLTLMRKGVRAARNVNLLRWARYYGIAVDWNLIWGLPGERVDDYVAQEAVIAHLVHLQPPADAYRIWMERFSPLFTEPATFSTVRLQPERSYRYVYPATVDLDRAAYFFDYEFAQALPDTAYAGLRRSIEDWQRRWPSDVRPELTYRWSPGQLQIEDRRGNGNDGTYTFTGTIAAIYLACTDRPTTANAVRDQLGADVPLAVVRATLDEFGRRGLMFLDDDLALALALPAVSGR